MAASRVFWLFRLATASSRCLESNGRKKAQQPVVLGELIAEHITDGNELGRLAPAFRWHALDGVQTGLQELFGARSTEPARFFVPPRLADRTFHEPPLSRPSATLSSHRGERAGVRPGKLRGAEHGVSAKGTVHEPVWCLGHEVHGQPPFGSLEILGGGRRNDALGFRYSILQLLDRFALVGFIPATDPFGVFIARTNFAKRTKMAFGCAFQEGIKDRGRDSHGWNIRPDLTLHTRHSASRTWLVGTYPVPIWYLVNMRRIALEGVAH
jgi:hypothetical protein